MKKTGPNKLILFDIDGTLIRPLRPKEAVQRFVHGLEKMYGKQIDLTLELWKSMGLNGMSDRAILTKIGALVDLSREQILQDLPQIMMHCKNFLEDLALDGTPVYAHIPTAVEFVRHVVDRDTAAYGIITGNMGETATWKLNHTGFAGIFSFGVYGHEAELRDDLAKLALTRAREHFGHPFAPQDVIVIGDTVHDIRCAKAIGAVSVVVTTGHDVSRDSLVAEKPDLLVETLMDERVLALVG